MKNTQLVKTTGAALAGLVLTLAFANAAPDTKKELLELTDGRRAKVAWNQGPENDLKLHYFDTKDGTIQKLDFGGTAPLWTSNGRMLVVAVGKAPERKIVAYDTETKKTIELAKPGPGNHVIAVWTDSKAKRTWIYVNDSGDNNEAWNQPAGAIHRFPADKPEERELFWDRTSSHLYLMFSEDGTRACFEPSWANIGQLKLAFTADGKVDQDNSEYKTIGGGCFPSISPDNSYRIFRLDGGHKKIDMTDADGTNPRSIDVTGMPGVGDQGKQIWLTRWGAHPRYMTLMGPDSNEARIWVGRFDAEFTKVEKWVAVSEVGGPKCWQSQIWVEPDK